MAISNAKQPSDLKNRVSICLNKLADRDTLSSATAELESIARGLSSDAFAPFLTCLSSTDSTDKSPVRRQCVRLIGVLSAVHGDALSPHLSKMLSAVLRRLRDSDSAVRAACVDAFSSIASRITKPPFSSILKPLVDSILHEQDYNSQIGASLCLAAAIEAAPEPEPTELKKLLPRLLKLVKNDCFKAKPAMLSLIGTIASAGGASSKNALNSLIPIIVEFLSSEDWATRKAAADAFAKLALAERDLLWEFKPPCLASLESRKFDKVKVVRESMNRALALWKEVPGGAPDEVLSPSEYCGSGACSPASTKCQPDVGFETPQLKNTIPLSRSPASNNSSAITTQKTNHLKMNHQKTSFRRSCKADTENPSKLKIDVAVPHTPSSKESCKEGQKAKDFEALDLVDDKSFRTSKVDAKRILFNNNSDDRLPKFGGLKYGSRVVPLYDNTSSELGLVGSNATEDVIGSQKEFENISLIREQLVQIENQQSNLLEILQRFIGSSQNGMSSLERRVNGLERVLDEMQHDLAASTGRISTTDSVGNTCCILPRAEFLSPKFWRKTEGQNSNLRSPFSSRSHSATTVQNTTGTDGNAERLKQDSATSQHKKESSHSVILMADNSRGLKETLKSCSSERMNKMIQDSDNLQVSSFSKVNGA